MGFRNMQEKLENSFATTKSINHHKCTKNQLTKLTSFNQLQTTRWNFPTMNYRGAAMNLSHARLEVL